MSRAQRVPRGLPDHDHDAGPATDLPSSGTGTDTRDAASEIDRVSSRPSGGGAGGVASPDPVPVVNAEADRPAPAEDPTPMAPGPGRYQMP